MKSKAEKERGKEFENKQNIARGLTAFQDARKQLELSLPKYDYQIDKAAELGDDEYSDQLIEEKVEAQDVIRTLEIIENRIMTNAMTANAVASLKNLDSAIKSCQSLLESGPNMKKIGKELGSFSKNLNDARKKLKDLRTEIVGKKDRNMDVLFGDSAYEDPKFAEKINAEKEARNQRLRMKLETATTNPNINEDSVSIDDITRMIDEENKKK